MKLQEEQEPNNCVVLSQTAIQLLLSCYCQTHQLFSNKKKKNFLQFFHSALWLLFQHIHAFRISIYSCTFSSSSFHTPNCSSPKIPHRWKQKHFLKKKFSIAIRTCKVFFSLTVCSDLKRPTYSQLECGPMH